MDQWRPGHHGHGISYSRHVVLAHQSQPRLRPSHSGTLVRNMGVESNPFPNDRRQHPALSVSAFTGYGRYQRVRTVSVVQSPPRWKVWIPPGSQALRQSSDSEVRSKNIDFYFSLTMFVCVSHPIIILAFNIYAFAHWIFFQSLNFLWSLLVRLRSYTCSSYLTSLTIISLSLFLSRLLSLLLISLSLLPLSLSLRLCLYPVRMPTLHRSIFPENARFRLAVYVHIFCYYHVIMWEVVKTQLFSTY